MGGTCCRSHTPKEDNQKLHFSGPISERSCTDVPCCIAFILCLLGFCCIFAWSLAFGDLKRLLHPTNSRGEICGVDVPGRRFLFYFDLRHCLRNAPTSIIVGCATPQVCVNECPAYDWSWKMQPSASRRLMICVDGKDGTSPEFTKETIESLVRSKTCAAYIPRSTPVLGRCLPNPRILSIASKPSIPMFDDAGKDIGAELKRIGQKLVHKLTSFLDQVVDDFANCWPKILICCVVSVLLSFLWILLMHFFAGPVVWLSLILFAALLITATGFSFYRYYVLSQSPEPEEHLIESFFDYYFQFEKTWLICGCVSALLLFLYLVITVFLRKRIRLAIALINYTSKSIAIVKTLFVWPLAPFILKSATFAICVWTSLLLRSVGVQVGTSNTDIEAHSDREGKNMTFGKSCDPRADNAVGVICRFLYFRQAHSAFYLQFFILLVFLWSFNFIKALEQMTLANIFAHCYFSRLDKRHMPNFPILNGLFCSLHYHFGSLAFGALILALVQWIRVLIEYVDNKFKKIEHPVVQALKKLCYCCLWCFEKCIKLLNENAYIMIAIHGQSFCVAAGNAFGLLARNAIRLIVVDKVVEYLMFIGKLVIVCLMAVFGYTLLEGSFLRDVELFKWLTPVLNHTFVPLLVVIVASYIVVNSATNIFTFGVSVIFICYLEDTEHNDGSSERPYYMSKELMSIMNKNNQQDMKSKGDSGVQ